MEDITKENVFNNNTLKVLYTEKQYYSNQQYLIELSRHRIGILWISKITANLNGTMFIVPSHIIIMATFICSNWFTILRSLLCHQIKCLPNKSHIHTSTIHNKSTEKPHNRENEEPTSRIMVRNYLPSVALPHDIVLSNRLISPFMHSLSLSSSRTSNLQIQIQWNTAASRKHVKNDFPQTEESSCIV